MLRSSKTYRWFTTPEELRFLADTLELKASKSDCLGDRVEILGDPNGGEPLIIVLDQDRVKLNATVGT